MRTSDSDRKPHRRRRRTRNRSLIPALNARAEHGAEPAPERTDAAAGRLVAQEEIQQDLQRFAALLSERVTQATQEILSGQDRALFEPALRHTLIAISSALDIAAGPRPEANLLDMVVFVTLSRDVMERHYVPRVFGEAGEALAHVFRSSERQIWELARKVLTPAQEREVRETIRAWQASHPEQTRVAGVRFTAFSASAADRHQRRNASGILAGVQSATRAADAALLLGERAMFLAPRIPAVLRLQARLGAHELLCDSLAELERVEARVEHTMERMEQLSRRLIRQAAWAGVGLIALFWLGYALTVRR